MVALPGFVDAHTHLPFAGDRAREFGLRIQGWTYQQLAARGMGILTTVKATRAASLDDLVSLSLKRLDRMLLTGTTTVEAKSGYGLNLEDEVKQLEALRDAAALHPVDIVPTFMGAHDIPPEYRDKREDYVRLLVETLIPEVRARGLAEFFDVFCEPSVFSLEETRTLVAAAKAAGFKVKVHADEFVTLGGAELAAELGASSAEHLIAVSDEGIARLAASGTAAILLPGVSFFLMMDKQRPGPEPHRRRGGRRPGLRFQPRKLTPLLDAFCAPARRFYAGDDGRGSDQRLHGECRLRRRTAGDHRQSRTGEKDGCDPLRRPGPRVAGL